MFKVGDRVITDYGSGTVIVVEAGEFVGVQHNEYRHFFHTLDGRCEANRGYWVLIERVQRTRPVFKGNK